MARGLTRRVRIDLSLSYCPENTQYFLHTNCVFCPQNTRLVIYTLFYVPIKWVYICKMVISDHFIDLRGRGGLENTPKWGVFRTPQGGTHPPIRGGSENRVFGVPARPGPLPKIGRILGVERLLICTGTPKRGGPQGGSKMAKKAYFDPFLGSKKGGSGFPQAFRGTPPVKAKIGPQERFWPFWPKRGG